MMVVALNLIALVIMFRREVDKDVKVKAFCIAFIFLVLAFILGV